MEDTLRVKTKSVMYLLIMVLILVLMEDTLREGACRQVLELRIVLILVLMEDTLRVKKSSGRRSKNRLNPCFNGRYSQSLLK